MPLQILNDLAPIYKPHLSRPMQQSRLPPGIHCDQALDAILDSRWEEGYQRIKQQMNCPEAQKDIILRKRILRFFQDHQLSTDFYYSPRQDINPDQLDFSLIFDSSLLIYGIDFLSLEKVRQYLQPFEVTIEPFDESHCAVAFKNAGQLVKYLFEKLIDRPENVTLLFQFFQQNPQETVIWRQIKGYSEMLFERKLWARFLTKQESLQLDYSGQSTKKKALFRKAKTEFLSQIELNSRNANRIRNNYGSNFPKAEEGSNVPVSCCANYEQKIESIKKMFPCDHPGVHRKNNTYAMKAEEDKGYRQPVPSRGKSRQKKEYFRSKFSAFEHMSRPLPIVQRATASFLQGMGEDSFGLSDIKECSRIEHSQNEEEKDVLFNKMLSEFTKYTPFDGSLSDINSGKSFASHQSGISQLEQDSGQF